jgi:hypothetical protein
VIPLSYISSPWCYFNWRGQGRILYGNTGEAEKAGWREEIPILSLEGRESQEEGLTRGWSKLGVLRILISPP